MSVAWEKNLLFEEDFLRSFGQRNGLKTEYVPNARLALYQRLLQAHSSQPDLLEIDVVWPAILADDLVDLRPYLKENLSAFSSDLLASYTVNGRLVALPLYVDMGVLFYRPELLRKYGFHTPPATWEDLGNMAQRIQQGERIAGHKDFWAYVWEGARYEGLTCNALEWQSSAGAGNFIEPGGLVHVRSPLLIAALSRAAHWMGTISPPAEYVYFSDDAMNIWDAGQTAFMRNWASSFGHVAERSSKAKWAFALAPLPKGPGGHRGALGGLGMGVSKYAANRQMAIKALLELTDERNDLARLLATNGIPTHLAVSRRTDVRARTSLLAVSAELLQGLVARPTSMTGPKYDQVSREYSAAVNSVLRRTVTPEEAMAALEKRLMKITGLPAEKN
jgi:trehalose/maltose transport system substrate-binding protein